MNFSQNCLAVFVFAIALTGCDSAKTQSTAVKQPYQRFIPIPAGAVMPDIPGGTGYYALDTKTGTLERFRAQPIGAVLLQLVNKFLRKILTRFVSSIAP